MRSVELAITNRLATAQSLYLRKHAENPIDWYMWGEEALETSRQSNKPISCPSATRSVIGARSWREKLSQMPQLRITSASILSRLKSIVKSVRSSPQRIRDWMTQFYWPVVLFAIEEQLPEDAIGLVCKGLTWLPTAKTEAEFLAQVNATQSRSRL